MNEKFKSTELEELKKELDREKLNKRYNFQIPVKVILKEDDFPILLGTAGFFNKFIITFNQKEEKILLKRVQD